ncbi:MAG: hypothetical protein SFZ02_15650 [bacterium]|nr:hypothetical protein [bacterium]
MTHITAQGETFFLIGQHHADFIQDPSASLHEPILAGWRRWMFGLVVIIALITVLATITAPTTYEVNATIIDKAVEGNEFSPIYRLTYRYDDHRGDRHEVSDIANESFYEELTIGSVVTVRYLHGQSQRAKLSGRYSDDIYALNSDFLWFLALALVILWMLIFWLIIPQRVNSRLYREGTLLKGVITNIYPMRLFRRYDVHVEFTFATLKETVIEAKAVNNRRDLEHTPLPKPNTPVLILYVNDHLYRLM